MAALSPRKFRSAIATRLVVAYLLVFPLDVLFLSRAFVSASSNPALYAALLGAIHFLLFVMLIRLYSANTDRDALFLTMLSFAAILASAVLTIDTTFPRSFLPVHVVWRGHVSSVWKCAAARRTRSRRTLMRIPSKNDASIAH